MTFTIPIEINLVPGPLLHLFNCFVHLFRFMLATLLALSRVAK